MDEPATISETHTSVVVFVGDRAYKLKKPVHMGFLDFSTRERREEACRKEVELNRRLAADVYLGVADVSFGGEVVDHLVVMRRMPSDRRLSLRLDDRQVTDSLRDIARDVAAFHQRAIRSADADLAASSDALLARWDASFEDLRRFTTGTSPVLAPLDVQRGADLARRYLRGRARLFAERLAAGRACDGHGDLQSDDIFLLDDGPRILDCIEFADEYRLGDVLADVAFLAMDLERLGHPELARGFLDHYRELSGDHWPASLEHHHIAYRAHVRAKVACLRVEQGDQRAADDARALHDLAVHHLEAGAVRLVLVGGLPGTGKTTLARALAASLGAVVLSTDELRKNLAGLDRGVQPGTPPHEGLYTPGRVRAVYDELLRETAALLQRGETVILDASWTSEAARQAARVVAEQCVADLFELRCVTPQAAAIERIRRRIQRGTDASDADERVARTLATEADPWPQASPIDTSDDLALALAQADRALRSARPRE